MVNVEQIESVFVNPRSGNYTAPTDRLLPGSNVTIAELEAMMREVNAAALSKTRPYDPSRIPSQPRHAAPEATTTEVLSSAPEEATRPENTIRKFAGEVFSLIKAPFRLVGRIATEAAHRAERRRTTKDNIAIEALHRNYMERLNKALPLHRPSEAFKFS